MIQRPEMVLLSQETQVTHVRNTFWGILDRFWGILGDFGGISVTLARTEILR